MCDSRCTGASSPPSHCRCSCGGANHGGGGRYGGYRVRGYRYSRHYVPSYVPPSWNPPSPPPSKPPTTGDYFRSIGKSALTGAVVYGLSAAVPPVGAVVIPAYTAWGYVRWGSYLYMAYYEVQHKGTVRPDTAREVLGRTAEILAQQSADAVAGNIVAKANRGTLFPDTAAATGVESAVITEMMKGSTSSALSSSAGELAKFVVGKAVGGEWSVPSST